MSIYSKEFLAIYMAFLEFAHILWEGTKPTIVLTDNKSVTRFLQTKAIPPALWNACDYVLQFTFKIAHVAGSVNTAADFLSRLELKVTEKIRLKIRERIFRQHLSRMLLTNNKYSSPRQITIMSPKNRPLNVKSNRGKIRSNGPRIHNHPP